MRIERFVCRALPALLLAACGLPSTELSDEEEAPGAIRAALYQTGQTVVAGSGTTYYTVVGKHCVYARPLNGTAAPLTGACNSAGFVDGQPGTARLNTPYGLAVDDGNGFLYVTDTGNGAVRRITMSSGRVVTVVTTAAARSAAAARGFTVASFGPRGVAVVSSASELSSVKVLVTDGINHLTYLYSAATATVAYHAGYPGVAADVDGTGSAVRYVAPDLATSASCTTSFFSPRCAILLEGNGRRRMADAGGKVITL